MLPGHLKMGFPYTPIFNSVVVASSEAMTDSVPSHLIITAAGDVGSNAAGAFTSSPHNSAHAH